MALTVDVARVTSVLLVDGWHFIQPGSFHIEDYVLVEETPDGRSVATSPVLGFTFTKVDQISREIQVFNGPLGSMVAFRHAPVTEIVE